MTINLCGMELEHPVMNAAGSVKSLLELEAAVKSPVSAIVIGSLTGSEDERFGNPEPRYYFDHDRGYLVNTMGLPEPGLEYYRYNHSRWMILLDMARESGKKIILSIALLDADAAVLGKLLELAQLWRVDAIELNLGCPNVWGGDRQKMITSFDPDAVRHQVYWLVHEWDGPQGFKMSPYSNPVELVRICEAIHNVCMRFEERIYIATANTFPNALPMKDGAPALKLRYGGFSGPAYLPIALGQTAQWVDALEHCESLIQVVGVGGITAGQDVADFRTVGATAVQIGAQFAEYGPEVFERIIAQWVQLEFAD